MLKNTVIAVLAGCLCASIAHAQHDGGYRTLWVKPGLELSHDTGDWTDVDSIAVTTNAHSVASAWAQFNRTLGSGWRLTRDAAFHTPSWIIGSFDSGISPLTADRATALTERFVRDLAEPLGISDPSDLRLWFAETTRNHHGHDIFGVDFIQQHKGFDVRTLRKPLRVRARWDLTLGKMSVIGSEFVAGLNVNVANPMNRDEAIRTAQSYIPKYAPGTGRVSGFETFVLVGMNEAEQFAHLVHSVRIHTDEPHDWVVFIDAVTGERLYVADHTCHVDVVGNVSIGTMTGAGGNPPAVPFSVQPARDLLVQVVGGNSDYTDPAGNFTVSHGGSANVTIQGRYNGRWCNVQNIQGANTQFSQTATPGTAANVVMNGTHSGELTTAEATTYFWTTFTRHMIADEWTTWTGLANIRADVNENNSCNAFYSGGTINFFTSGNGCNNTAIPDVVAHEYGHAFHANFFGSINNGQFSEGIGDHLGLYARTQWDGATFRNLGEGFRTTGGSVRDYRTGGGANNEQWPSAGKPVHTGGQIWAGAMIDMMDYLIAKHGFSTGSGIARNISLAMYSRRPSDMPPGITETMVQDDNDADLSNGTPNFAEIARAADRHSIPRPADPLIVRYSHTPLGATGDVVNGYVVTANISSTAGSIQTATLTYQVNNGAPVNVPMTGTGGVYSATIPAQSAVSTVTYSMSATDNMANSARLPATGAFAFLVGREIIAFQDDFETNKGWGPDPTDNATTGIFQRVDPFQASQGASLAQPEDDTTPNGTMCWVTQNGTRNQAASGHDVDNGKTSVVSPQLDWTSIPAGAATVSFSYWLTMYTQTNDFVRLDVSTNNGSSWTQIWSNSTTSATWRSASVTVPGAYTNQMRLRFWTQDSPNNSVTDALFDDVEVKAVDDNVAALTANTRSPAIGTTLNYTLNAAREPNAAWAYAISFTAGPTTIPGVGTVALGAPIYAIAFGSTDAAGNDTFGIPIPNQAALRGLDVYTQAVVAGSANIISNLWKVQIQ